MKTLASLSKRTRRIAAVAALLLLVASAAIGVGASGNLNLGSLAGATYSYDPSLVAYWTFDEGSGTTANDSSGNGRTGTLKNGASFTNAALPALQFADPVCVEPDRNIASICGRGHRPQPGEHFLHGRGMGETLDHRWQTMDHWVRHQQYRQSIGAGVPR